MADLEILTRFRDAVRLGKIRGPYEQKSATQPLYVWYLQNAADIEVLIAAMWPLMGTRRRDQASLVLDHVRPIVAARLAKRLAEEAGDADCGWRSPTGETSRYGLTLHRRRGEDPCLSCLDAARAYSREYQRRRRRTS